METDHFNLYHQVGGNQLAQAILPYCVKKLQQIEEKIGYRLSGKLDIYLYPSIVSLNNLYVKQNFDAFKSSGGTTLVQSSNIHVAYQGSQTELLIQISDAIAENLIAEMLYGGTIQERIKYATMLHLPNWFSKGLAQYLAREWDDVADNKLRDGFNNSLFTSFNQMSVENQILAGRSMWQYLEEKEGPGTIQRILYLVRLTRKVETALYFVLHMDSKELYEHWRDSKSTLYASELKRRMPAEPERINFPLNSAKLLSLDLSPEANFIAASNYQNGNFEIVIFDRSTQNQVTVYQKFDYLANPETVTNQYLVKWKSESELFVIENGVKPKLMLIKHSGRIVSEQFIELKFIHWLDYHPENEELVFSATKNNASNLFLYDIENQSLTQLTSDLADDLYPTFTRSGNIYFSKLVKVESDHSNTQQQYDIFLINKSEVQVFSVENITNTSEFDELFPIELLGTHLSFVSNRNGIRNAYALHNNNLFALTDYQSGIEQQIANQSNSKIAEVVLKGSLLQVYVSDAEPSSHLGSVLHPNNTRTKDKIETVWAKSKSISTDSSKEIAKSIGTSLYFQSHFPVPENVDSLEKIRENYLTQKVYNSIPVGQRQLKILPTAIYAALDNSNMLTNVFPSFTSPASQVLNRFGFLLGVRLEDQYKFHSFSMRLKTSTSLNKFQFNFNYQNRKGFGIKDLTLATENYIAQADGIFKRQELRFLDGYLWIPQPSKFVFGLHHSTRFDALTTLGSQRESFENGPEKQLNTMNGFVIKYGNPLGKSKWATIGWNVTLKSDWVTGLSDGGNAINNGLNLTYGKEIKNGFVWYSRLHAGSSNGKLRTVYFLGGTTNQISPNFLPNPVLRDENSYYQPVYGVRNFDINVRNGNSYVFANSEFQIPAFQYLSKKPLHNAALQNLWLVIFGDVGTAWYGESPYNRLNPANRSTLSYGALDIVVYNTKNPLVYSFGSGIRTQLSGYDLRYDLAYTFDNNIWRPHIHRFSVGLPF